MIARKSLLALLFCFAAATNAFAAQAPAEPAATILCYHVVESPSDTKFSLTREAFRQQMRYLATAGFNVIPLEHLHEYLEGKRKSLPKNAVVITVDDGWKCTYTVIYPELKSFRFPFTLFLYPKFVGQSAYALSWKEVREMADDGVDIQSHAYSHPFLTRRRHPRMTEARYAEWLNHELAGSKKTIEKQTGKTVKFLAYPYGDYDNRVIEATKKAGYAAAVTAEFGHTSKESDPHRLRRVVIEVGTSFAEFRRQLGSAPLMLASSSPKSGSLFSEEEPVVSAKIRNFASLDPNSVGMAVLSLGSTPFSYNPDDGTISMVVREPFKTNRQQVVIWGRDRTSGKRLEATWSFYADELPPAQVAKKKAPADKPVVQAGSLSSLSSTVKAARGYLGSNATQHKR